MSEIHHFHKYYEPPNLDPYRLAFGGGGMVHLACYQADCYAEGGPRLDRTMYPAEKIGPKLRVVDGQTD